LIGPNPQAFRRRDGADNGHIGTFRKFKPNLIVAARTGVIFLKLRAQLAGLHADNGIDFGIVIGWAFRDGRV
jgi:hypothetical protein